MSRWSHIRAMLITVVLLVHGLKAMPLPRQIGGKVNTPTGREEINRWVSGLNQVGIPVDTKGLVGFINTLGGTAIGTRDRVLGPFLPIMRATGTGQAWALFAIPTTHPKRLEIWGETHGGEWRPLYRRWSKNDWNDHRFHFRRLRGMHVHIRPGDDWIRFSDWVARQAFDHHPDLKTVRIERVQTHITLPWERRDHRERRVNVRKLTREDVGR